MPTTGADGALARLRLRATGVYGMYGHLPYDHVRSLVLARRYRAELDDPDHVTAFSHLKELAAHGRLTLLTGTKRSDMSEAAVLADLLNSSARR